MIDLAYLRRIPIHEAVKASAEELKTMELLGRGVWSDEVETMAKGLAFIASLLAKSDVKWEAFLPERYVQSATMATERSPEEMTAIRRRVSKQLDAFVRQGLPGVKQPK